MRSTYYYGVGRSTAVDAENGVQVTIFALSRFLGVCQTSETSKDFGLRPPWGYTWRGLARGLVWFGAAALNNTEPNCLAGRLERV